MVNLFIEGQLIDQYADESVEIVSSVLDVQDITKNTGDYSKTFTVPTSKRNNKVFKHWYNATIDGGFDARTRVTGTIDIDGVPFRSGKWLLRAVKMVKGVPDSYQINFFGETASLQQILGKDVLRDLDLTAFDHTYDSAEVQLGLETGLFSGSVIYTTMSQKGMFYNSNPTQGDFPNGATGEDVQLRNIAALGNGTGLQFSELRPSLKVMEIINAIEAKYNITFSRDFFGTTEFDELYMWLAPDLEGGALGNRTELIEWNVTDGTWINTTTNIATYVPLSSAARTDRMEIILQVDPEAAFMDVQYTIAMIDVDSDEILAQRVVYGGDGSVSVIAAFPRNPSNTSLVLDLNVKFTITSTEGIEYVSNLTSRYIEEGTYLPPIEYSDSGVTPISTSAGIIINRLLPEMEVSEFIKGLIQLFKLVVIGREGSEFHVNSLDAFYRQGLRYDIGKYVDYAGWDVERGEILGELDFKFAEPSTILATQFLDDNGVGYGDSKVKLKDLDGEPFDGDTLTIDIPFETIVYERLTDGYSGVVTAIQVGNVMDITNAPVFTAPHLHYASKIRINDLDNHIKFQSTVTLDDYVWMPMTHSGVYSPAYSLLFESENSTYTNETLSNTLYSNHYQNYIEAIFNIKRRTLKVSANLPIQIITRLDLNDIITIDKLDYRINNFKYNLLTGLTQLELINGFDKFETNDVILPTECFQASNLGAQYRFNIPNIENYIITSSVVGGGTAFVTDSVTRNQLILDVDAWTSVPVGEFSRTTELVFTSESIGQGDVIRNGTFTEGTNGSEYWEALYPSGSFTFHNGYAQGLGMGGAGLFQTLENPLVAGCDYLVTYTISSYVSGWIDVYLGGSTRTATESSNGTYVETVTASIASTSISFQSVDLGSFNGRLSNLSVVGCKTVVKEEGGMCITQTNQGE